MKHSFLTLLILIAAFTGIAQVADGDYRSLTTGNWNAPATWQRRAGGLWATAATTPTASDNVFLQAGHTITLTQNESCNDFHISANSSGTRLAMAGNTLVVNGKLRAMTNTSASTGTTDANIPGTSTATLPGATSWITAAATGGFVIAGGTRTLTASSEWGAGNAGATAPNGFEFTVNPNAGAIITNNASIKARNITINSGTVDMSNNRLAPDQNTAGSGTFTIANGAVLISAATGNSTNSVVGRTGNANSGHINTFTNNGTIYLSGSAPEIQAATVFMNGTVVYNGTNQKLLGSSVTAPAAPINNYNNLTLAGSGSKSLAANTTITSALSAQGATTLSTATFSLTYAPGATLEYNGTASQTTGDEFPGAASPANLRINNAAGVTLAGPRTLTGNLDLTLGNLNTTATNLLTLADGAMVSNASNNSYVSGPVAKAGNHSFIFPTGKGGVYRPAGINNTAGAPTDVFTAEYFKAPYNTPTVTPGSGMDHISRVEYWDIARTAGTSTPDVTLSFDANSGTAPGTFSDLTIAHFNGTTWDNLGQRANSGSIGGSGTLTAATTSLTSFSPFTIGTTSAAQPLPLERLDFRGTVVGDVLLLKWTTACESGILHYEVEKSVKGDFFTPLGKMGAQNKGCSAPGEYTFQDETFYKTGQLYRLRITETNGKTALSKTLYFDGGRTATAPFVITPNPATTCVQVSGMSEGAIYTLTDMTGRVMMESRLRNGSIPIQTLPAGLYILQSAGLPPIRLIKQ